MSSPDNNNPNPNSHPTGSKDEIPPSGCRKTANSSSSSRPQEPALKCPRCDSSNTKFCYYNNYSLTQPRHFCKTCRRYWTRGGALRSVPIGGGCRKNKKMKSSAISSRICSEDPKNASLTPNNNGLKFFQGLSPAMDFQLGGTNTNTALFSTNQFSSFLDINNVTTTGISCFNLDPSPSNSSVMGFGFPLGGSMNVHKNFESLSSMNQEMHWKLQQQRLAMLFVGENQNQKEINNTSSTSHVVLPLCSTNMAIEPTNDDERTQHFLFENLDNNNSSKIESFGTGAASISSRKDSQLSTEWFFDDNSYAVPIAHQTPAASTSESHLINENTSSWSNGINQAWSDLTRYTALP